MPLLDLSATPTRCPSCGQADDATHLLQMWADDGEADLADWWECEACGADGAVPSATDPTKTQNGKEIK